MSGRQNVRVRQLGQTRRGSNKAFLDQRWSDKLTDDQISDLWIAYEELGSYRAVAEQFGLNSATVARYLRRDPIKFAAVIQSKADARSEKWRELERAALDQTAVLLDRLREAADAILGSDKEADFARIPSVIKVLRAVASDAATKVQLLTGQATDRIDHQGAIMDMTDEQLLALAQQYDLPLPPGVRDRLGPSHNEGYVKPVEEPGEP